MNPKQATALLGVVILVGSEVAGEHHASLVPHEHTHSEMRTEPVASTAAPVSASGAQRAYGSGAFGSEAFG